MAEAKLIYRGLQSGKTNHQAMVLADLAKAYTTVEIKVVSEEMLLAKQEISKLRAVAAAAQTLLTSCCEASKELHGMLELEGALEKLK